MLLRRKILFALSIVLVIGSLSTTLGYAFRLRSDGYRRQVEQAVSELLGMRLSIGAIEPMSLSARRLTDLSLWMPDRNVEVFQCRRAVWRKEVDNGATGHSLELERGWLLVGADEWKRADYEKMLRSGLGLEFATLGLRQVHLDEIDVIWRHPTFTLTVKDCKGQLYFDEDGTGRATLQANRLNDVVVDRPIGVTARFTPGGGLRIHDVVLDVPDAPLSALKLDGLLGSPVTQGEFSGQIRYHDTPEDRFVSIAGSIRGALLRELTGTLAGGPYDGRVDISVDEATFGSDKLRSLRFSGNLSSLRVGQFAEAFGVSSLSGRVDLRIHQAHYMPGRIDYLSAEGRVTDVSLEPVTRLFGRGTVTGRLRIEIHSLLVVDDHIQHAEVTLVAVPPDDGAATIDREVLKNVSEELLGLDATKMLPRRITEVEYARMGVRLVLNRDELRLMGTHGPDGKTLVTIKIFGQELGVLGEPNRVFHIEDPIELLRKKFKAYDAEQLREWWYKWRR